jgi:hypothetical protein
MLNGVELAVFGIVPASLLVAFAVYGLRVKLDVVSVPFLALVMAAIGFGFGTLPGVHGQGP